MFEKFCSIWNKQTGNNTNPLNSSIYPILVALSLMSFDCPAGLFVIPVIVISALCRDNRLIPSTFVCNCRHRPVSGEYDRLFRERQELAFDSTHECIFIAAEQVAASAAPCKQNVSGE